MMHERATCDTTRTTRKAHTGNVYGVFGHLLQGEPWIGIRCGACHGAAPAVWG